MRYSLSRILRFLLFLLLPLLACSREPIINDNSDDIQIGETVFSLLMSPSDPGVQVKSSNFDDNSMSALHNVVIYGIDDVTGQWKRVFLETVSNTAATTLSFQSGHPVTFYALGNMGDVEMPVDEHGALAPEAFEYLIPNTADLRSSGIPMASKLSLSGKDFDASVLTSSETPQGAGTVGEKAITIKLERLMAKVIVSVNKSGLTNGTDAAVLESEYIRVRQANRRMRPFHPAGSAALSASDLFSGAYEVFDIEDFSTGGEYDMTHADIVLYIPENRQGFITGEDYYLSTAPNIGAQGSLCTYIEYEGYKNGNEDGVYGSVSYRGLLGNSNLDSDDFSVCRNTLYTASLSLTWNGLMWSADGWRIDASNITDGRRLRFLDEDGNETSYLKIHRNGTGDIYAFFSVDGGINGAMGRKDASSYPFGWNLFFNGNVLSGHDGASEQYDVATGLSVKCLGEETVGSKRALHLQLSATSTATVTTSNPALRPVFSLRTTDNKVSASPLLLDVEDIPFTLQWLHDAPNHVGQKGVLQCIDPYTNQLAADYSFHVNSAFSSSVSLTDNGDGTASVSLLSPFTSQNGIISVTDDDGGRESHVGLEARLPHFECTDLWTTYVDACASMRFVYYGCREDGTSSDEMLQVASPSDPAYTGVGGQLDKELVESLIAPAASSLKGKLGFSRRLMEDGSYSLTAYVATYHGLSPSGKSFEVDEASVGMEGQDGVRPPHRTTFTAWNPWKNIGEPVQGRLMTDYTLYCEPNYLGDCTGWSPTPRYQPTDERVNTMNIQSIVVANGDNLSLNARFSTNELLGSKVFSGTPSTVSPEFSASSYTLRLTVARSQMDGASRAALLGYLRGRGCQFTDETDMMNYLGRCGDALVIGDSFVSSGAAWAAAAPGTDSSTGSWRDGVSFSVSANAALRQWALTYSMKGITREDLSTHGAGELALRVNVRNPYDGSLLEKEVGSAYMRLFIYAWPIIYGPYPYSPGADVQRGTFGIGLYAPVTNVTNALEDLLGSGYSMGKFIARAERELWFNGSNYTSTSCGEGETYISTTESTSAEAGWYLPEDWDYLASYPKSAFKDVLSYGMQFPFYFKSQAELNALRGDSFFRESDYRIYYDPSGSVKTYSYGKEGFDVETKGKLFVIELGAQDSVSYAKDVYFTSDYR